MSLTKTIERKAFARLDGGIYRVLMQRIKDCASAMSRPYFGTFFLS